MRLFTSSHLATTRPFFMRKMSMPVNRTALPLGSMPRNTPLMRGRHGPPDHCVVLVDENLVDIDSQVRKSTVQHPDDLLLALNARRQSREPHVVDEFRGIDGVHCFQVAAVPDVDPAQRELFVFRSGHFLLSQSSKNYLIDASNGQRSRRMLLPGGRSDDTLGPRHTPPPQKRPPVT
jgi:hypothetical protein